MRIRVHHSIGDLADDLAGIAARSTPELAAVVHRNVNEGTRLAKRFAQAASGPHGKSYHKRISGEMTGTLQGEFGPWGEPRRFVGAGYRHAGVNMDLPNAADIVGPKLADQVGDTVDGWFW